MPATRLGSWRGARRSSTPTSPGSAACDGIAVQYWFYYWFNQFNDLHESDWEMIQVAFDAATVEEALARGPSQLAYAQHDGGERRDWNDPRVEKDGTHPVVYVSSGSHASQYWSALFLGNGRRGSGLGCDDTRGPSTRVEPTPILVPTFPAFDSPARLARVSAATGASTSPASRTGRPART